VVTSLDTPNAAHIHAARAGINGPISVTLVAPMNDAGAPAGNPGTSSGCINDPDAEFATIIRQMKGNPSLFYINVHSGNFPSGGVRGQLH
jgi:hypothetical protein